MKSGLIILFLTTLNAVAIAQHNIGVATSNYSGINSMYLNPAFLADDPENLTINIFGVSSGFDNNVIGVQNDIVYPGIREGKSLDMNTWFSYKNRAQFSMWGPYTEMRSLGFICKVGTNSTIALTTRVRAIAQFDEFNVNLFRTLFDDQFASSGVDYNTVLRRCNATVHAWSEIGISYAGLLYYDEHKKINWGVTARYLNGIGFFSMVGNELSAQYNPETQIFTASGGLKISGSLLNEDNKIQGSVLGILTGAHSIGSGASADIGITYEYRKKEKDPWYKYRLSLAFTDIGFIKYKSDKTVQLKNTAHINVNELHNGGNDISNITDYLQKHGLVTDTSLTKDVVNLPRTIIAAIDYSLYGKWFVNFMTYVNIADRSKYGNSCYTQFTLTPRYDIKRFTFAMPFSYNVMSKNMKMGIGIRVGPCYIGSDDMLAFIKSDQPGMNMYAGFGINPGHIRSPFKFKKHNYCRNCETYLRWDN